MNPNDHDEIETCYVPVHNVLVVAERVSQGWHVMMPQVMADTHHGRWSIMLWRPVKRESD